MLEMQKYTNIKIKTQENNLLIHYIKLDKNLLNYM